MPVFVGRRYAGKNNPFHRPFFIAQAAAHNSL